MMVKNKINKDLCKKCGGRCCKKIPGFTWPEDLMVDNESFEESIFKLFISGNWSIDWWEGDPREGKDDIVRGYFIRSAIKGCEEIFDPSWGGECCFLSTEDGCVLSFEKRPRQCRELIPVENNKCFYSSDNIDKKSAAVAWIPYHNILISAKHKAEKYLTYSSKDNEYVIIKNIFLLERSTLI
jgi:Fe-S-cluster containining protein